MATDRLLFPQISIEQKSKLSDLKKEENEPYSIILDVKGLDFGNKFNIQIFKYSWGLNVFSLALAKGKSWTGTGTRCKWHHRFKVVSPLSWDRSFFFTSVLFSANDVRIWLPVTDDKGVNVIELIHSQTQAAFMRLLVVERTFYCHYTSIVQPNPSSPDRRMLTENPAVARDRPCCCANRYG